MEHINSSSFADDYVIMLCVIMSDLVLAAVTSTEIPTDPEISGTVLCEQAVKDTLKNVVEV